jgi:hypothetical protein
MWTGISRTSFDLRPQIALVAGLAASIEVNLADPEVRAGLAEFLPESRVDEILRP